MVKSLVFPVGTHALPRYIFRELPGTLVNATTTTTGTREIPSMNKASPHRQRLIS